jgi:hypothetical protein
LDDTVCNSNNAGSARVVNCSGLFRNVTVFDRRVTAHGRADPNRLNERDHRCQDRQQVRYRYATGAVQRKKDVAFQIPVNGTNGQITANVKSASIDHRLGLAAHHAIDEKCAFIAAML